MIEERICYRREAPHNNCNILSQEADIKSFIAIEDVRKGKVEKIDWKWRNVYWGIDLALSEDKGVYIWSRSGKSGKEK